jgi:hypothetical protein
VGAAVVDAAVDALVVDVEFNDINVLQLKK